MPLNRFHLEQLLAAALVFGASALAGAQDFSRTKPHLQAATTLLEQHVCFLPSGHARVTLKVELTFTNVGTVPVIVSKNSGESSVYIGHTVRDALAKNYEYAARGDLWEFPFRLQPEIPPDSYVILKPHDAYRRDIDLWGLWFDSVKKYSHYSDRAHFIRLDFYTIDETFVSSEGQFLTGELSRRRWKTYGYLVDGVTTQPMLFQPPHATNVGKCDKGAA